MKCNKRRFESKAAALKMIRKGSKKLKSIAGRVRAYLCPHCHGYHITSQEKNNPKGHYKKHE